MSSNQSIVKKASLLTLSQLIALLVSAALVLLIPKFVSVEAYGYWQLFLLYAGYVGIFHFGYSDGLYISAGGKNLNSIDAGRLRPQFILFLLIQVFFAACCVVYAEYFAENHQKWIVYTAVGVYLVVENYHKLISFLLLATAHAEAYAVSVLLDKAATAVIVAGLIFFHSTSLPALVAVYIFCRLLSLIYLMVMYRRFIPRPADLKMIFNSVPDGLKLSRMGAVLMISNILGTLIIAAGRIVVEKFWDISLFAQISLAVSLSFFIISLISQVSLVLFPILRNSAEDAAKNIFEQGNFILGYAAMLSFGLFFLLRWIISIWLPEYTESLTFLVYLFPLVLFEMKTQILYVTFCKSLNKLKLLFSVNIITLAVAVGIYFMAVQLQSIETVLIGMLVSLLIRSILLYFFILRKYGLKADSIIIAEVVFSAGFILAYRHVPVNVLLILYIGCAVALTLLYRTKLQNTFESLKKNF